ncbi:hypothetical protein ACWT_2132 [Actinoplanes sp. SE50]|nr:hypothetical protein ACPL_2257 [Actinoplanes sp. SE50/110]ATO81547.1 hypothetical protein ACWT_2132 [Actinoplanes sp. SE50]SLL98955.1 hypothetical protein ACSP50_2182 [Actinoplanes sp. SE50/110]
MVTAVPVARAALDSRALGEVQELMSQRYVEHRARVGGHRRGFADHSRFTAAYRTSYGRLPRQTLHT